MRLFAVLDDRPLWMYVCQFSAVAAVVYIQVEIFAAIEPVKISRKWGGGGRTVKKALISLNIVKFLE